MKKFSWTVSKLFAIGLLLLTSIIAIHLTWAYFTDILACLQARANKKICFAPNSPATLELFLPKMYGGDGAIIIFPGGGYQTLK